MEWNEQIHKIKEMWKIRKVSNTQKNTQFGKEQGNDYYYEKNDNCIAIIC